MTKTYILPENTTREFELADCYYCNRTFILKHMAKDRLQGKLACEECNKIVKRYLQAQKRKGKAICLTR